MKPGVRIELNQHLCLCWMSWELVCANLDAFRGCLEGERDGGGEMEKESVSLRGCSVCPPVHISMNAFQNCWVVPAALHLLLRGTERRQPGRLEYWQGFAAGCFCLGV